MQSLMIGMPTSESYYDDAVNAEKAPEIINNSMLYAAHKVPPSPHVSSVASTSRTTQPHPQPGNMDLNNMNSGCGLNDFRQLPSNQIPFLLPPLNLPVETSQSFPGTRDYLRPPVMDSENRPFGDMYRDYQPPNINFMTMPQLSIPPPILPRQSVVPEPQVPPGVILSNQTQAQQIAPNQLATSDTERAALIMQILQYTDAQIAILPAEQL